MDTTSIFKLLSSFYNAFNKNKKEEDKNSQEKPPSKPAPLTQGMLNTMHSHDEFVKRVSEKNYKKENT